MFEQSFAAAKRIMHLVDFRLCKLNLQGTVMYCADAVYFLQHILLCWLTTVKPWKICKYHTRISPKKALAIYTRTFGFTEKYT